MAALIPKICTTIWRCKGYVRDMCLLEWRESFYIYQCRNADHAYQMILDYSPCLCIQYCMQYVCGA